MISKNNLENIFRNIVDKMDDLDTASEEFSDLTEEDLFNNIKNYSSEKLSEIVVIYRYLGMYKDLSIKAMEELLNRKINNDSFDFDGYINNKLNSYPKINFKIPDLSNILKDFKK